MDVKARTSEYVTVVSVGSQPASEPHATTTTTNATPVGYVTVLQIGTDSLSAEEEKEEEVLVYRLPGERLGFGLKFEGGTKAAEHVKRLFIQSCAPDSPASRVRASWGRLTEGDEVLAIDATSVRAMTRIDCVRCLKDSNVVIKLLVKHAGGRAKTPSEEVDEAKEDLPLVIGAEKKRQPPPPPPVPPRKVPRKKDLPTPPLPTTTEPEPVKNRDRKLSDGSLGPPDAEVYVDLFSHRDASPYYLSESDDTGSSISTVVDRFASLPTTTASSCAGSVPSTPNAAQRRTMALTNPFDDDEPVIRPKELYKEDLISKLTCLQEAAVSLQPPVSFQDAPLSYADEEMRSEKSDPNNNAPLEQDHNNLGKKKRPPPPPPRKFTTTSSSVSAEKNNNDYDRKDENEVLPRLVDFLPKTTKTEIDEKSEENKKEVIDRIEEINIEIKHYHERQEEIDEDNSAMDADEPDGDYNNWTNGEDDYYGFNWTPSTQLATIGEDEEEEESLTASPASRSSNDTTPTCASSVPIIVVDEKKPPPPQSDESVSSATVDHKQPESASQKTPAPAPRKTNHNKSLKTDVEIMDTPSINTRQPPDGHEFPDYQERPPTKSIEYTPRKTTPPATNVKNMIAMFSNEEDVTDGDPTPTPKRPPLLKAMTNVEEIPPDSTPIHFNAAKRGSLDLSDDDDVFRLHSLTPRLHTRSQSLIDISDTKTNDRWTQMLEQRRRGMSKLKGLVIPEHESEDHTPSAVVVDLPVIKSEKVLLPPLITSSPIVQHVRNSSTPTLLATPPWREDDNSALPKYSPAFKRKTLQVYPKTSTPTPAVKEKEAFKSLDSLNLSDAPKSLESITSPTRSDCSFEYASSSPEPKPADAIIAPPSIVSHSIARGKCDNDSDNDSAVSSSQSSYASRQSPPASPNHLRYTTTTAAAAAADTPQGRYEQEMNRRMLKAQSVEAINRKNILASAKCRSGKDLNGGSPLIQRKFDEDDAHPVEKMVESSLAKVTQPKSSTVVERTAYTRSTSEVKNGGKYVSSRNNNTRTSSVTDLRKTFEKAASVGATPTKGVSHGRHSIGAVNSRADKPRPVPTKRSSLPILAAVPVKPPIRTFSIDAKKIIEETLQQWEESINIDDVKVVTIRPEIAGGSIGITLAGGTDYETKEVTVHKVRNNSAAHRDGRLQKGDRILSINGQSMNGVTHATSMAILKEPVTEVVLVTCPSKEPTTPSLTSPASRNGSSLDLTSPPTPPIAPPTTKGTREPRVFVVKLAKDNAASGLGFSMAGGKDSPQGDVPLVIKKLFTGGNADKCGQLAIGDELLEIDGVDVQQMPRIDAWALTKKIPVGEVTLRVRR